MKLNKRTVALLVSLALLLTAAIGVTVAYILDRTAETQNTFAPSYVDCEVLSSESYVYTVKNIGDTDAYVRVAVVVNWKNTESGNIYAQAPQFEVSAEDDNWILGKDGYYYFKKPIKTQIGDDLTTKFQITPKSNTPESGEYQLSVEIVASAIQATTDAVKDWSSGVATAATDGSDLTVTTH